MIETVAPARHLRIAVPAYTGQISVQTAHSLTGAVPALLAAGVEVDTDFLAGCCYLDHTRNVMADRFLKSKATDLLFIDADVAFAPDAVLRIVRSTKPVLGGIYPKKSDDGDFPVAVDAPEIWADRVGDIECALVPTGFLRISRAVFDFMAPWMDEYEYLDAARIRAFFKTEVIDGVYWGEDAWFCRKWRELGGKVHAMAEVEFGHVGTREWRGKWPPNNPKMMEAA